MNTLPRLSFDGIKRWFISEDGEASWSQSDEAEEALDGGEETGLPFEPDEDSESILDELLDDIHQEEAEAPAAEAPLPPPVPEPEPAPAVAAPVAAEEPATAEDDGVTFEVKQVDEETQLTGDEIDKKVQDFQEYDPTLDLSRFKLPNIDLLVQHGDGKVKVTEAELDANKTRIIETLATSASKCPASPPKWARP